MKNLFWLFIVVIFNNICFGQIKNEKITLSNIALDTTLEFKIKNTSGDTLYFLNDWESFYRKKSKSLHVRTYPELGGMMSHNVTFIKLCPNEEFNVNMPLYRLEENNIKKIVIVIGKIKPQKMNYFKGKQGTSFTLDNREAISMISVDSYIFSFNRTYEKN